MDKIKAKVVELVWWTLKWAVAAVTLVAAIQVYSRLDRHNLLVDAILREFRETAIARDAQMKALQKKEP